MDLAQDWMAQQVYTKGIKGTEDCSLRFVSARSGRKGASIIYYTSRIISDGALTRIRRHRERALGSRRLG